MLICTEYVGTVFPIIVPPNIFNRVPAKWKRDYRLYFCPVIVEMNEIG